MENLTAQNVVITTKENNLEEIKNLAIKVNKMYSGMVYTEDTVKSAKKDKADLNKLVKGIEDARKEFKKEVMKPYEEIEPKVKEIVGLIKEPVNLITKQLNEYDEKKKEDKRKSINLIYADTVSKGNQLILPIDKIWNEKWLNSTFSIKKVKEEIEEIQKNTNTALDLISSLNSEFETELKNEFLNTFDLSNIIPKNEQLKAQKEAQIKLEEERQEMLKKDQEAAAKESNVREVLDVNPPEAKKGLAKIKTEFWVEGTDEQLKQLGEFIKSNGMAYGKIRKEW